MKLKKLISLILVVMLIIAAMPLSASAKENYYTFGCLSVRSEEKLMNKYICFGTVKVDYDVEFRNNTLYVNTSKHLIIEPENLNESPNVRIVFEHNANVALNRLNIKNENSIASAITVNSGKTVNLDVWSNTSVQSLNSSALTVNGTLNLDAGGNFPLTSLNGCGVDGNGTLNLNKGTMTVKGTMGGIDIKSFNCEDSTVKAYGTAPGAVAIGKTGSSTNVRSAMESFKAASSVVIAEGGENTVAIGAASNGKLYNMVIENSVVTATGGNGADADIGTSDDGEVLRFVIDGKSSVKGAMNITPVNSSGNTVVLNKIDNPNSYSIFIDDYVFPYLDHLGEKSVYAYLTEGFHDILLNSEVLYLGDFEIRSNSPSFSPSSLSFDTTTHTLKVNTSQSFIISNKDSSNPTEDRIFITKDASPKIVFDGVNIKSSGSPVEIEADSNKNVCITLAEDSVNSLISIGNRTPAVRKAWDFHPWYNPVTGKTEFFDMPCGTLTVDGEGLLYVEGGPEAAAFGTDIYNTRSKNITIAGGNIVAVGGTAAPTFNCTNFKVYQEAQLYCPVTSRNISWNTPTDKNGSPVYQLCLENCTDEVVYVDGVETTHEPVIDLLGYNVISFFVSGEEHCVEYGEAKDFYCRNGERFEKFTPSDSYDTGDFVVTGGEPYRDYSYSDGVLTVKASTAENTVTISNIDKNTPTTDTITVPDDSDAYMILDGVNIDTSSTEKSPFSISSKNAGNTYVILAEDSKNILKGNGSKPTIYKPGDQKSSTLTIRGEGELTVIGNGNCAVGASDNEIFSHFYIEGGTINLSASGNIDVIGAGETGGIKDIAFERADITLTAESGDCIGGGRASYIDSVVINSGNVRFNSGNGNIFCIDDLDKNTDNKAIKNIKVLGGIVTFDTVKKIFSVPSANKQVDNFVIDKNATVLSTKVLEKAPVNSDGDKVFFCPISNPDSKEIYIDGELFPYTEHDGQTSVYPYLSGKTHSLSIDDTDYIVAFDSAESKFIFREMHEHTFEDAWQHNYTHHWHECTVENCWLLSPELYSELSSGELTASGYGEHSFNDFVCVCGFEDITGCREFYKNIISNFILDSKDCVQIRNNALMEIDELTTVSEIKSCYNNCVADIDAKIIELSTAIASATDEINQTLDSYKSLLETEHSYNITEVRNNAESGIRALTTASSLESVSNTLNETLLNMKEEALNIAKLNTCLEIEIAALSVDIPSDSVSKTVSTAKKAISITDSLEDIFDITDWAISLIEKLGTEVHEHTFSDTYSNNETAHWYPSTCGHDDIVKGFGEHTFGEGVQVGNSTVYTCTECNYVKIVNDELAELRAQAIAELEAAAGTERSDAMLSALELAITTVERAATAEEINSAKERGLAVIHASEFALGNCTTFGSLICGLETALTESKFNDNYIINDTVSVECTPSSTCILGTGSTVSVTYYNGNIDEYSIVIFGDVNGDGWYDGTDSIIVNCIANGMLTREQVGEPVYMAADCNHDGVIDSNDVDILQQAGVLLASVDQSKTLEELQTNSAYVEYLNLIDQTVETETTKVVEENDVDPGYTFSFFDMILNFVKEIIALIKSVIAFFK